MNLKSVFVGAALVLGLGGVGYAVQRNHDAHGVTQAAAVEQSVDSAATAQPQIACNVKINLLQDACTPAASGKNVEVCVKVNGKTALCAPVQVVDPKLVQRLQAQQAAAPK